ncbi:hypothetical protein ACIQGT_26035 [Streptomyces sp. NPDC093108]|uniref:hypothetical protein n=1 Tax=Streptomyces sp. NPDC093108 TaxID=3366030 RepID=UPI003819108C
MLANLLRTARARLFPRPLLTATYSCGRCGLRVQVTDRPDNVTKILNAVVRHGCTPKTKAL